LVALVMKRLKVMLITHDMKIGGLQRVVTDMATHLDRNRFEPSVCALRGGGPFAEELQNNRIRFFNVSANNGKVDYLCSLKLRRLFKEEKPDIVHTHNTQPFIDGTVGAMLAGVPVRIHTDHARDFPDKRRYMYAEYVLSHFVDRIVAVSNHTKQNLVRFEHIDEDRIDVIPNGIDGDKYEVTIDRSKKMRELDIPEGKGPILGIGVRLSNQKGITYLLRAMKSLSVDLPNAVLLIAGEGELRDRLEKEAIALGIGENVRFLGARLDINEILKILDVYVLPSLWEGMPLVLLEAMAASLPIVATDVGGNADVVIDGQNGFLVKPGDIRSLYLSLRTVLENQELRARFSKSSYDRYRQRFHVGAMINGYETLYAKCSTEG
jgi:sugar transferase (PEP-CTERM/EpsH1 system associated)